LNAGADGVLRLGLRLCPHAFNSNVTADFQAGFGAGDVEEAWADSGADFDVIKHEFKLNN
jgi:hypothetical protein